MNADKFTHEEIDDILSLAHKIEEVIEDQDFSTVFNALLVALANGGRVVAHDVPEPIYMHMVTNNMRCWREFLDDEEAEEKKAVDELTEQFKRTDWYYQRAEGNGYYEGRESYEKTMRMVNALGSEGRKLMEVYLAEHGIKP